MAVEGNSFHFILPMLPSITLQRRPGVQGVVATLKTDSHYMRATKYQYIRPRRFSKEENRLIP